jgi:hypothetical protein
MSEQDELENLSIEELQKRQLRDLRMINLCINIPVIYESNVALSEELLAFYKKECKDYASFARNMVADNIRLEDIATLLNLPQQGLLKLFLENNWIENTNDFEKITEVEIK